MIKSDYGINSRAAAAMSSHGDAGKHILPERLIKLSNN